MSDVELSYFAALIDGIRLIDDKAKETGTDPDLDANAIMHYVQIQGERIHVSYLRSRNALAPA